MRCHRSATMSGGSSIKMSREPNEVVQGSHCQGSHDISELENGLNTSKCLGSGTIAVGNINSERSLHVERMNGTLLYLGQIWDQRKAVGLQNTRPSYWSSQSSARRKMKFSQWFLASSTVDCMKSVPEIYCSKLHWRRSRRMTSIFGTCAWSMSTPGCWGPCSKAQRFSQYWKKTSRHAIFFI